MHYQLGNTLRLVSEFKDWTGAYKDPDSVQISIQDIQNVPIIQATLGPDNKLDTGVYFYDHVLEHVGEFIYEWTGTMEGTPSVKRDKFRVKLI